MRKKLLSIVDGFGHRTVAVVGDLIADEFLYGQISRISREAPVLVVQYKDLVRVPGGAANAAYNLLDLGSRVVIYGVVGRDEAGKDLIRMLAARGGDTRNIIMVDRYSTPIKTRVLAGAHHSAPQQIVRVDRIAELDGDVRPAWRSFGRTLDKSDALILSDYGYASVTKSVVNETREIARRRRIPIVVDSRFRMGEFREVTALTPNITELEAATSTAIGGDPSLLNRVAREVLHRQELACLLVTQGRFGMTLFERRRRPLHIPIYGTDEVADVTGAGDTVIAVFTLALACGASPPEAARLANYAGGTVVMKRGTATVNAAELRAAITKDLS
jgi:rfaE bifunctional protein kinase chain/domain